VHLEAFDVLLCSYLSGSSIWLPFDLRS